MRDLKRLRLIASLVEEGSSLVDVGTDHGKVPLYLLQEKKVSRVIATDISQQSIQDLQDLVDRHFNQWTHLDLRLGDGLGVVKKKEVDGLLMSGLGGFLMMRLFDRDPEIFQSFRYLVLQANNGREDLRRYLHSRGWKIEEELDCLENGHYYTIIKALPGRESYNDREYQYGRRILARKSADFRAYLREEIQRKEEVLADIGKSTLGQARVREEVIAGLLEEYRELLGEK